jgi:acetylglutamate/LysW-gamma-L-alpha-aminoadipate kinase
MIGVVKIGGAPGNKLEPLMTELAERTARGEKWVLVHGASGMMDALCAEHNIEIRMITSPSGYRSRFVGEAERILFREAALSYGLRIKDILAGNGVKAEQIDPESVPYVAAKRKDILREYIGGRTRIVRGNYSGTVTSINAEEIMNRLESKMIPVLPPLGMDAESGLSINIDGDRLAACVAGEIMADVLLILSNIPGLMRDINDPGSIIRSNASVSGWDTLEHYAKGNMKRKLVACREALDLNVRRVYLADGRVDSPIENALRGNATCLTR